MAALYSGILQTALDVLASLAIHMHALISFREKKNAPRAAYAMFTI
jgi:hypothetical protein